MKKKKCSKCKKTKKLIEFHKNNRSKDGYKSACKDCRKTENKKWRDNNKDKERGYYEKRKKSNKTQVEEKVCAKCNKNKDINEFHKNTASLDGHSARCKECQAEDSKKYRQKNKEEVAKRKKEYATKNKKKIAKKSKIYYEKNKDRELARAKRWREENREYLNEYFQELKKTNIHRRIATNLRSRLNKALKNNYKTGSAVRDLGCSIEELKICLESKFQTGMTWGNYGEWHIDHIVPLVSFDLTNREQFIKACHYTNLQPLWAKDNLSKGSKIGYVNI